MRIGDLLNRLSGVRALRDGSWTARCPAHEDRDPSLHITLLAPGGSDEKLLLHCFAGCPFDAILDAAGVTLGELRGDSGPAPSVAFTRPTPAPRPAPAPKPARVAPIDEPTWWDLRDVDGRIVASHKRVDWRLADGSTAKDVTWWQPDHRTPTLLGRATADLPLYGAHLLAGWPADAPIALVEGEKAADALTAAGIPAVGTVCGAGVTPNAETLAALAGRVVVLWADNDDAGRRHMARIAEALADVAGELRAVLWRDAPAGGDAADFLATQSAGEARVLIANAPGWTPSGVPEDASDDVDARLEAHRRSIADLQQQVSRLMAVNRAITQALANPKLRAEKGTAIALALAFPGATERPDGWKRVPLARIAEAAGVSPQTASHHLRRLAECGVIERRVTRTLDDDGNWRNELLVRSQGGRVVDILAPVATAAPPAPPPGADRPRAPRSARVCPDCGDAGVVVACACCGQVLGAPGIDEGLPPQECHIDIFESADHVPGQDGIKCDHIDIFDEPGGPARDVTAERRRLALARIQPVKPGRGGRPGGGG